MKDLQENRKVYRIALLVAISCVLQLSESLIPHPIPGLRLGLANMVTLIAFVTLGFGSALQIAVFRTILSSVIMGTFMSPTFILSFSAAVTSTLVMGLLYRFSRKHHQISIIGISIMGALCHNMVQLYLAYLLLVKHGGVFVFLPWLCIGGVVMGWVTGVVAARVCRRLEEAETEKGSGDTVQRIALAPVSHHYLPGASFLHRLPAELKIISIIILSVVALVFENLWFYLGLFSFLALVVVSSGTSPGFLFSRVWRYGSVVLVAFLLPVFFNSGSHVLTNIGAFKLTYEGASTGALFSLRIAFLILVSALLVRTTSPEQMTRGIAWLLSPLRYLGVSQERTARILCLSWMVIPSVWEEARSVIGGEKFKNANKLRNIIPILTGVIAHLYLESEPESTLWKSVYRRGKTNVIDGDADMG